MYFYPVDAIETLAENSKSGPLFIELRGCEGDYTEKNPVHFNCYTLRKYLALIVNSTYNQDNSGLERIAAWQISKYLASG